MMNVGQLLLLFLTVILLSGGLFILLTAAAALRLVRRRRAVLVLSHLEQAVRLNLPLPEALLAATFAETRGMRERLARLRTLLEEGQFIGDALAHCVPEVSARTVQLTLAAERAGRLPQTLRRLAEQQERAAVGQPDRVAFQHSYLLLNVMAVTMLLLAAAVWILPQFQMLTNDFGTALPWTTLWTFNTLRPLGALALMTVVVLALVSAAAALWEMLGRRSPYGEWGLGGVSDRLLWHLPLLRTVARDRSLADACHVLAESLRAGVPLDVALSEATSLRINQVLRAKLNRWSAALREGALPHEAARRAHMPALVVGFVGTATGGDQLADVLAFLGGYYDGRFSRALALIRALPIPVMTVAMGLVVGWIVISLFMPLAALIEHTAAQVFLP